MPMRLWAAIRAEPFAYSDKDLLCHDKKRGLPIYPEP